MTENRKDASSSAAWITGGLVAILALLWLGLIRQLQVEWTLNSQYSYGWGVPFLVAYLLWKRWPELPTPQSGELRRSLMAIAILLLALLLPVRLVQEANPDWRLVSWASAILVVGLTLLTTQMIAGTHWLKALLLPIAFILIAVPWPTPVEQWLIQKLMRGVAAVTVELVNWLGIPAIQRGNLIELPTGMVGVNEACSGVRSFQATLMASIFLGELHRFKAIARIGLIFVGVALAIFLNIVRTSILTWLKVKGGTAAVGEWHDPAGYIVLGVSFAGLWALCHWLARGTTLPTDGTSAESSWRLTPPPFLSRRIVIAGLAWIVCVELTTEGWYLWHESKLSRRLTWSVQWPSGDAMHVEQPIEEESRLLLRYNEGQSFRWKRPDTATEWLIYHFVWSPGRAAAQLARGHNPEACLPAGGLKMVKSIGRKTFNIAGLDMEFQQYLFDYRGLPCHVFFCLWEDRSRKEPGAIRQADFSRWSRFQAVKDGERHLGQRVLEIAIVGSIDELTLQNEVEKYLRQVVRVP